MDEEIPHDHPHRIYLIIAVVVGAIFLQILGFLLCCKDRCKAKRKAKKMERVSSIEQPVEVTKVSSIVRESKGSTLVEAVDEEAHVALLGTSLEGAREIFTDVEGDQENDQYFNPIIIKMFIAYPIFKFPYENTVEIFDSGGTAQNREYYTIMPLKWGIAGAGNISTQFAKCISVLPQTDHIVEAVAAQSLERAQQFAADLNIPKSYGSYNQLATDKDIDVVYVGNLNTQHLEVSKLMLAHGKHVLCEKPLTLNEIQTRELIDYAKEKGLFLMEAIWSRCFPAYDKLRELIDSGTVGDVLYATANFGRPFKEVERIISKELGGGTILDLGIYALQFVQFVYKGLKPISIVARGRLNENGVDESASAILDYDHGKIAIVSSHSRVELVNEGCIIGTKGMIQVPRFWCPTTIVTPTETFNFELPDTKGVEFKKNYSVGMSYEAVEVGKCIKAGNLESTKITHKESLELAKMMDKIRSDVGVVFPQDKI
ncbi:hypothetical protein FQR65_LT09030 [Abscondita terminalis]|nr:hypothetical protein FQR65_LT09030 [Abscondita terminalis]